MGRARRVATASRECSSTFVSVEADSFFSPLGKASIIGGVFPEIGTLIDCSVGARALVQCERAEVGTLAVVARAPAALRGRVEAPSAGRRGAHRLEHTARLRLVRSRQVITQIVIIVGYHAGAAQVRPSEGRARL